MNAILKAARYARDAHAHQKRKYTDEPYIIHPMRVAGRVMLLPDATEEMVVAAWLHDVIEDCGKTEADLAAQFGERVAGFVASLTNPSASQKHLPRAERKAIDREHLSRQCREVVLIKLCDRIDNVLDLARCPDANFLQKYGEESKALAEALRSQSSELYEELCRTLLKVLPTNGPS